MLEQSVNFDRAADYYDATRGFPEGIAPQIGTFIAEALGLNEQTHLLEVGIGTGRIALPLAPHAGRITGVDISTQMMGKLREKRGEHAIEVAAADAHQLPFASNSFDAVYITHVLHLVADPARVLQEIVRVVKAGQPFVHMRNRYGRNNEMQSVIDAWNLSTADHPKGPRRWDNTDDLIAQAGLQLVADHIHSFEYTSKLSDFLERIERRQWSSTWLMTDALWQRGVDAVHKVVDEQFGGNRDFETRAEGKFQVQVYRA